MAKQKKEKTAPTAPEPAPQLPPGDAGSKLYRDRFVEVVHVPASSLRINPKNWRTHPEYQTGAVGVTLDRIGFIGTLIARRLTDGSLELIDGHLRRDLLGAQMVPVTVVDLTDAEADEALGTYDQLTSLSLPDNGKLSSLLVNLKSAGVPLVQSGWPEFKLAQVLQDKWVPPAGGTTDLISQAFAQKGGSAGDAEQEPDATAAGVYKQFQVPLSIAQEVAVRAAIRTGKALWNLESSGDVLTKIVEAWVASQVNTSGEATQAEAVRTDGGREELPPAVPGADAQVL